ncbi:MAG: nucleotide exchange factor GrpE [Rickettsiales bacterium]|jgi:molecular chaperone GrpE|nr:nucleotide exchange factor GrpE [Rickettsiales bacterium]
MPENKEYKEHKDTKKTEPTQIAESKPDDELEEMKDKYLRTLAELENTRKRAVNDTENAARARAMSVAEHFLPLIDAIDKAVEHTPDDEGVATLKKAADNTIAKIGIVRIETAGETLNPQFHNAISTEDSDLPANKITKEMQSGFMFGDSVLRPAMVIVSKGASNELQN